MVIIVLYCVVCYKLGFSVVNVNEIGLHVTNDSITKGHSFKLYKQFSNRSVRSIFFTVKVLNVWKLCHLKKYISVT